MVVGRFAMTGYRSTFRFVFATASRKRRPNQLIAPATEFWPGVRRSRPPMGKVGPACVLSDSHTSKAADVGVPIYKNPSS